MKLAAQLYTVRDYTKTDDQVKSMLGRIKEIGYDAVQLSGIAAYNPTNIAAALKEYDLQVCATHTPHDRIVNETDKVIEEHKLFGAPYVGIGYFRGNCLDDYKKFADEIEPAVNKINAAGLGFLYHNHAHELAKYDSVSPIDFFCDRFERGKFDILADLFWLQRAGCSPVKFLRDRKGRIPIVHFKDMRVPPAEGMTEMAEIFCGNMDYDSIYCACRDTGIQWAAVEQDVCDGDPFESLRISRENLRARKMFG